MSNLSKNIAAWQDTNPGSPENEFIEYMNRELLALYPNLILRWSKIYGSRWAYLCGNSGEVSLNPVKIALNHDYGICIDNPDILNKDELARLIFNLRESLADDAHY